MNQLDDLIKNANIIKKIEKEKEEQQISIIVIYISI